MDYALSDQEIWTRLNGNCRVMSYRESLKYPTIDALLGPSKAAVILYETSSNRGHWTCVFKRGPTIVSVFDSYGYFPDSQFSYIKPSFRARSGQTNKHLTQLLLNCPYQLEYNATPFQKVGTGIATCGRWVALRLLNRGLSPEEFERRYYRPDGDRRVVDWLRL
jgi:hypothetical protein